MKTDADKAGNRETDGQGFEPFIGKGEVAKRMEKSVRTVDYLMSKKLIPFYRVQRSILFRWSEIQKALAESCRVAAEPKSESGNKDQ